MDELKFQARIVKEVLKKKGWARKIGNPHQAGTPDLFIKLYTREAVMVECKLKNLKGLTAIQRNTMEGLLRAGMPTGWLVLQQERTVYNCFVGSSPLATDIIPGENCTLISYSGKEWEIGEIVNAITYWAGREMDGYG